MRPLPILLAALLAVLLIGGAVLLVTNPVPQVKTVETAIADDQLGR